MYQEVKNMATTAKVGRPREFDREKALDAAVNVFWAKGYDGAALSELTEAMGINKPSLYAAFGDKRGLFDEAVERYSAGPWSFAKRAYEMPTAKETVRALLEGAVSITTTENGPGGCLYTRAALSCDPVRDAVVERRRVGESKLQALLRKAQKDGEVPEGVNCAALAKYVLTMVQGIAVQGAGGATRRELKAMVEVAMEAWPGE
jgi:AcrR family transcriptional regulator